MAVFSHQLEWSKTTSYRVMESRSQSKPKPMLLVPSTQTRTQSTLTSSGTGRTDPLPPRGGKKGGREGGRWRWRGEWLFRMEAKDRISGGQCMQTQVKSTEPAHQQQWPPTTEPCSFLPVAESPILNPKRERNL